MLNHAKFVATVSIAIIRSVSYLYSVHIECSLKTHDHVEHVLYGRKEIFNGYEKIIICTWLTRATCVEKSCLTRLENNEQMCVPEIIPAPLVVPVVIFLLFFIATS